MSIDNQQGPLTAAQLMTIWQGAVDTAYSEPLLMAGEGQGLEVYTQAAQQIARLSQAVDFTTQQLFIQPWSGQSGEPASGPAFATVALSFTRAGYTGQPVVLKAGIIFVDEIQNDFSPSGPSPTNTGRRYSLLEDAVFAPGESGPITVQAQAVKSGYGYNNPLPGSLSFIEHDGTGLNNDLGTVTVNPGPALSLLPPPVLTYTLTAYPVTDMPVPDNIGQYILFTAGANAGQSARVASFIAPTATAGSAVTLEPLVVLESYAVTGTFQTGEIVALYDSGPDLIARGIVVGTSDAPADATRIVLVLTQAPTGLSTLASAIGQVSSATASSDVILYWTHLVAEAPTGSPLTGGATWRVLDWAEDWQITCTNATSPGGGRLGMLDLVGRERKLPRQNGEIDADYRDRLWNVVDVVTPNALKRALYRALGTFPWCYRETINGLLPGFFYDRGLEDGATSGGDPNGDFYDDDMLLWTGSVASGTFNVGDPVQYQSQIPSGTGPYLTQANGYYGGIVSGTMLFIRKNGTAIDPVAGDQIVDLRTGAIFTPTASIENDNATIRRWNVYLDYQSFRAYFIVQLPALGFGEYGFAYDNHPFGAFDCPAPFLDFYDGYPYQDAETYGAAYAALNTARAGGVAFDFFLADGPCV